MPRHAYGMEFDQWQSWVRDAGFPVWRGGQIFSALQRRRPGAWNELTELPRSIRGRLEAAFSLAWPAPARRHVSRDGTVRYLLDFSGGTARTPEKNQAEAVYLPDEVFDDAGRALRQRATFCISSQIGCAVNCQFCLTALLGLERSLDAGEIVAQVQFLLDAHEIRPGDDRVNLVFMGMGEPFLNYDAVLRAVRILCHPRGAGLAPRRITISTSGIVDKIRRYGDEPVRPRLAISLNAPNDELRAKLMPLHRGQGGLAALMAAAREYPLAARERLTFEYVLLARVNDEIAHARELAARLAGLRAKVNLIAWNAGPELGWHAPSSARVTAFQSELRRRGVAAYIRRPRGQDIFAACGQLKRHEDAVQTEI